MTKKSLKKCAEVFTGYTFRLLPQEDKGGDIFFVQPKDIDHSTQQLIFEQALKISSFDGGARHFIRQGDLLVASKGKSTPVLVFRDSSLKVVSSSAFIVIRPFPEVIDPQYLGWYLQLPVAQSYLQANKAGTTVLNLSVRSVQDMEVEMPVLALQQKIGNSHQLLVQQNRKQLELITKQRALFDHTVYQLVKK